MATAYLSFAQADVSAAAIIRGALSGRWNVLSPYDAVPGRDLGGEIERMAEAADCIVLLWSAALAADPSGAVQTAIAIRAWAQDRLILARADNAELPAGLRDIPAIDFSDGRREPLFALVDEAAARLPAVGPELGAPAAAASAESPRRRVSGNLLAGAAALLAIITVIVIGYVRISLQEQSYTIASAPVPGLDSNASGPPQEADRTAAPAILIAGGGLAGLITIGLLVIVGRRRRSVIAPAPVSAAPSEPSRETPPVEHIFVSYSRRDQDLVDRIVGEIENTGLAVWIDRRAEVAGSGRYAAPIVTAIKASRVVALMCSRNSFESDHVIREIYVAGDFRKPFIAFQLDPTEFPDEIRYFLSGFPRVAAETVDAGLLKTELARLVG